MDYVTFIYFNDDNYPQILGDYKKPVGYEGDDIVSYDKWGNVVFTGGSNNE